MISPSYIAALQKGTEVEYLLTLHTHRSGPLIHRLPVPPEARISTAEARRVYREKDFKDDFRGADFIDVPRGTCLISHL
jgi:hypothetical protein